MPALVVVLAQIAPNAGFYSRFTQIRFSGSPQTFKAPVLKQSLVLELEFPWIYMRNANTLASIPIHIIYTHAYACKLGE